MANRFEVRRIWWSQIFAINFGGIPGTRFSGPASHVTNCGIVPHIFHVTNGGVVYKKPGSSPKRVFGWHLGIKDVKMPSDDVNCLCAVASSWQTSVLCWLLSLWLHCLVEKGRYSVSSSVEAIGGSCTSRRIVVFSLEYLPAGRQAPTVNANAEVFLPTVASVRDLIHQCEHSLVGGLEHVLFSHILGISSSQLTFIFFRGVA